jgi:small-conductance mechanosensitive channel
MEVRDLFVETKKVVNEYKAKAEVLDKEEQELQKELVAMQEEMTAILLDQENANLSERIYLKAQAKGINSKLDIVHSMLEELNEKKSALKLAYVPVLQDVLRKDRSSSYEYDVTELAIRHRYELLTEVAGVGKQFQQQYHAIAPEIYEVFEDTKVKEEFPRLEHSFNQGQYQPHFSWFETSIISKNELFSATRGNLPDHLKAPKEGK